MKRLHKLLINSFIKPLIATFFVAQFILILQFLWQHIDDLAGKGLEWNVIAELLLYASAALVPLALPLAVLLSSIMTFGNLGEYFELAAIKSSGISLQKFMRPLIILVIALSIGAFFYANHVIPYANLKALSLRFDIKQQREELQIREGVFYNDIEGYSIKVGHKNPKTNLLKDIMIYQHDNQKGNVQVTKADSGYIRMTSDETKLLVTLYDGHTYEEMGKGRRSRSSKDVQKFPHQIRKFAEENLLIDISGFSFKRTDEGLFKDNYQMYQLSELEKNKDSLVRVHSTRARELFKELNKNLFASEKYKRRAKRQAPDISRSKQAKRVSDHPVDKNPRNIGSNAYAEDKTKQSASSLPFLKDSVWLSEKKIPLYTPCGDSEPGPGNYVLRNSFAEFDGNKDHTYFMRQGTGKAPQKDRPKQFNFTTFYDSLGYKHKMSIIQNALGRARTNSQKITNSRRMFENRQKRIYKHQIYWHKKFTLSFACIIFFFIGAPLGSIIRKGGLGAPLVISVIMFIIYYIISITGENFVEKGVLPAFFGMWLSSLILMPVGIFLTYKATNDSVILNTDTYIKMIRRIISFGLRKNGDTVKKQAEDFREQ